ncbi:MAG: YraN family protein [Opitutaceae bacterium]|nr:YraN family protein [Opitutaceae bacterium]
MWAFLRGLFSRRAAAGAGERGERLAAAWLRREKGFAIIVRNWRNPADRREEIDLVGRDGEVLVFVEVKTRAAGALVPGYHAIDERKRRVLRRAIQAYLVRLREPPRTYRFDVVEVATVADDTVAPEILHFENVPLFPGRRR